MANYKNNICRIYEMGTFTPIEILNSIPEALIDESVNSNASQGVFLFNQAITLLNTHGFKFPYIVPISEDKSKFDATTPYTPLPDKYLMGFVQTYMAYRLSMVEEELDMAQTLYSMSDGYQNYLTDLIGKYLEINPVYIGDMSQQVIFANGRSRNNGY